MRQNHQTFMQPKRSTFSKNLIIAGTIGLLALTNSFANANAKPKGHEKWVTTYAAPPQKNVKFLPPLALPVLENQTVRNIVRISKGGDKFRIRVANTYGSQPLKLTAASVAVALSGANVQTPVNVTFAGQAGVSIPVGSDVYSDAVSISVANDSDLAVSFYFAQSTGAPTIETDTYKNTYVAAGNQTSATTLSNVSDVFNSGYFMRGVEVLAPKQTVNIAAIGDSITDGFGASVDGNSTYPMALSARLHQQVQGKNFSVVNVGIGGNRLTEETFIFGQAALTRFDSDVLSHSGITHMVLLEGINDIGLPELAFLFPDDRVTPVTAELLISGFTQMARKAQAHGIKVIVGTILPYKGSLYYTEQGNNIRKAVNEWIRTTDVIDGVVDFDELLKDPSDPEQINPAYDLGDFLHLNDVTKRWQMRLI